MIKKIPWPQLFVEAVLVVLSVLLALALNNWRQSEMNEDLAQRALHNIVDEVRANTIKIEETLAYHKKVLAILETNPDQVAPMRPAFIQNNAWETAQATRAVMYIDYDIAAQVSEIHELQEKYQHITQAIIQTLYLEMNNISSGSLSKEPMLQDMLYIEQLLLNKYENLIYKIET